jgi:hypothetical protein
MRAIALVAAWAVLAQPAASPATWTATAPGVEHATISRTFAPQEGAKGQWAINALRIDPGAADLQVVHALDAVVGLETVSSMAARHGASAAVNGGFFATTGTYRGDSLGALMIDGELLSEPDRGRAALAIIRTPSGARVEFGHARADVSIRVGAATRPVNGLNRPRAEGELIVFTHQFHRTTLTSGNGVEAIVRRGRVERVVSSAGSSPIPADGLVLSASGGAAEWLRMNARSGARVELRRRLRPVDPAAADPWSRAEDVLGAGPQLLKDGRVEITSERERMSVSLSTERHPRTAIGTTGDGRVLLVVVDGRQPGWSDGMLLEELAQLLRELGAVNGINLDGGGSSTMVVQGKVVNRPSDAAGERPVSDAILIKGRR